MPTFVSSFLMDLVISVIVLVKYRRVGKPSPPSCDMPGELRSRKESINSAQTFHLGFCVPRFVRGSHCCIENATGRRRYYWKGNPRLYVRWAEPRRGGDCGWGVEIRSERGRVRTLIDTFTNTHFLTSFQIHFGKRVYGSGDITSDVVTKLQQDPNCCELDTSSAQWSLVELALY